MRQTVCRGWNLSRCSAAPPCCAPITCGFTAGYRTPLLRSESRTCHQSMRSFGCGWWLFSVMPQAFTLCRFAARTFGNVTSGDGTKAGLTDNSIRRKFCATQRHTTEGYQRPCICVLRPDPVPGQGRGPLGSPAFHLRPVASRRP